MNIYLIRGKLTIRILCEGSLTSTSDPSMIGQHAGQLKQWSLESSARASNTPPLEIDDTRYKERATCANGKGRGGLTILREELVTGVGTTSIHRVHVEVRNKF